MIPRQTQTERKSTSAPQVSESLGPPCVFQEPLEVALDADDNIGTESPINAIILVVH